MEEISIGEFARRSRLSVKALRLYDELGVLTPARIDGNSGYRYYDVTQLDDARLVAMLRQLEFPSPRSRNSWRAILLMPPSELRCTGAKPKPCTTRTASSLTTLSTN